MIKAIISDFSKVLLFPKDKSYQGKLNALYRQLSQTPGYNIFQHFELNTELLNLYSTLKDQFALYMFTSDVIQDAPEVQLYIQSVFTKIFSASKININKKDVAAYKKILAELNLSGDEVVYIDDTSEYIQAATQAGLHTIQYINNEDLREKLSLKIQLPL